MPAGKTAEPTDWNWLPVAVGRAWMAPDGAVVVGCDQAPRRRTISSVRMLINPLQLFPRRATLQAVRPCRRLSAT